MSFKFTFRVENEANTVPYPPVKDDIRDNRGFVDLRGRPDVAREIAEGHTSPALRDLLIRVADPRSPIFTVGCDLGIHTDPTSVPLRRREVAGGYIQLVGTHYRLTPTDAYAALANAVVDAIRNLKSDDYWKIDFVGRGVRFKFEDAPEGIWPCLWIWFFGAAREVSAAIESRERLITAVSNTLVAPDAIRPFTGEVLGIV
jgi:hypothetical protein